MLTYTHAKSCTVRSGRKKAFPTAFFFDRILLGLLLIVSRVPFYGFVLFLEAVGVREYWCMAAASRLEACLPRAFSASNPCFTRDEPSPKRVVGVGFRQKTPTLSSWRCTQPRAIRQSYSKRSRCWQKVIDTARCCHRMIDATGGWSYSSRNVPC